MTGILLTYPADSMQLGAVCWGDNGLLCQKVAIRVAMHNLQVHYLSPGKLLTSETVHLVATVPLGFSSFADQMHLLDVSALTFT